MKWSAAQALAHIAIGVPVTFDNWGDHAQASEIGRALADAELKLAAAIGSGRITAWGAQTPDGRLEEIPADILQAPKDVVINHGGSLVRRSRQDVVVSHEGTLVRRSRRPFKGPPPAWQRIRFDGNEVIRAFPPPTPMSAQVCMANLAKQEREAGRFGKRDDLVKRCMAAAGCSKREAQRAYAELEPNLKLNRGRPRGSTH